MSRYNPKIHNRRSIRLKGYDYRQEGLYFITLVVQNRKHLFGQISNGEMHWNQAGEMIEKEWLALKTRFEMIQLHEFIVMPDHFHAILEIIPDATVGSTLVVDPIINKVDPNNDGIGRPQGSPQTSPQTRDMQPRLGDIIMAFKSITTVEYIKGVKEKNWQRFNKRLWQRNYWEHIIRNEKSFHRISNYIRNNPLNC